MFFVRAVSYIWWERVKAINILEKIFSVSVKLQNVLLVTLYLKISTRRRVLLAIKSHQIYCSHVSYRRRKTCLRFWKILHATLFEVWKFLVVTNVCTYTGIHNTFILGDRFGSVVWNWPLSYMGFYILYYTIWRAYLNDHELRKERKGSVQIYVFFLIIHSL